MDVGVEVGDIAAVVGKDVAKGCLILGVRAESILAATIIGPRAAHPIAVNIHVDQGTVASLDVDDAEGVEVIPTVDAVCSCKQVSTASKDGQWIIK